jgi:CBS domain containing-hemolysin-like protein
VARPPLNLLETFSILNALEQMRKQSTHIAFVVNEFGDFMGLLTMTDILESIAGELPDASEMEGPGVTEDGQGFVASGALTLNQLQARTGFVAPVTADYQTLGGLLTSLLDRLPAGGDQVIWQEWQLTVLEVEDRRAKKVRLMPL